DLSASVVYYGTPPMKSVDGKQVVDADALAKGKAPVAGFYGGKHPPGAPPAAEMKKLGKTYETHVMEGAGHGFLKGQAQSEANAKAASDAWPLTIAFLKQHTKKLLYHFPRV